MEQRILLPTQEMQVKRADVLVTKSDVSELILDVQTAAVQNPPERVFMAAVRAKQKEYVSTETNKVGDATLVPLVHTVHGPWGWDAVSLASQLYRPIAERLQHSLGISWGSCYHKARVLVRHTIVSVEMATKQRVLDNVRGVHHGQR